MNIEEIFTTIYRKKLWGDGSSSSPLSGTGSIEKLAEPYSNYVKHKLYELKINSVTDFGHGDFTMWGSYKFNDIQYIGIDVVPYLSLHLNKKYSDNKNMKFICIDITKKDLPISNLLLSKDCLQHLSNSYLDNFFKKIQGFNYLILCNDRAVKVRKIELIRQLLQVRSRLNHLMKCNSPFYLVRKNRKLNNIDINNGGYRTMDLEIEPFVYWLKDFKLIEKFDYHSPKRIGVVKTVYFFSKSNFS